MKRIGTSLKNRFIRPALRDLAFVRSESAWARLVAKGLRVPLDRPAGTRLFHVDRLEEFLEIQKPYQSVSFDIFDTLIRRIHANPELIKPRTSAFVSLLMAREGLDHEPFRLIHLRRVIEWRQCEASHGLGHDPETELTSIYTKLFEIYGAKDPRALAEETLAYETISEVSWMEPDPVAAQVIKSIRASGKPVYLLSDMYLDAPSIDALLDHCGLSGLVDAVYVSSQTRKGKYSGQLFKLIADEHGVDLSRHIHIGDSMRSDVRGPLQQGVSAAWLAPWKPEARPSGDFASVLSRFLEGKCAGRSAGYRIGYEILGPIMLLFGAYVLDQAIAEGAQTIWFLAREGKLYESVCQKVWDALPRYRHFTKPDFHYAYLSRASVAPGSIDAIDMSELILSEYRLQPLTVVNLCQTFGLDESVVIPLAQLSALHPHEGLDRWEPRLHHLLRNEEFCRHVTSVAAKANRELTAYLDPLMPKDADGAIMLCDAGWSGTIQSLLHNAFAKAGIKNRLVGCYLGMNWSDRYQFDEKTNKIVPGFLLDSYRNGEIAQSLVGIKPLLEVAATAEHGSTQGYRRSDDGSMVPILAEPKENFQDGRRDFQQGLNDFIDAFLPTFAQYEWPPEEAIGHALQRFLRLTNDPTLDEARAIGALTQSVDWGADIHVHVVPQAISPRSLLRPRRAAHLVLQAIWREGAIRSLGLPVPFQRRVLAALRRAKRVLHR